MKRLGLWAAAVMGFLSLGGCYYSGGVYYEEGFDCPPPGHYHSVHVYRHHHHYHDPCY
jgi:hypothetical protein